MLCQCHKHISYDLPAVTKQQFGMCVCVCGSRRLIACTTTPLYNRTTCYLANHLQHQYLLQMSGWTCRSARPMQIFDCQFVKTQSEEETLLAYSALSQRLEQVLIPELGKQTYNSKDMYRLLRHRAESHFTTLKSHLHSKISRNTKMHIDSNIRLR